MQKFKSISCLGYRGFQTKQTLNFAEPNGEFGSGLTVLIGPNGGGKSTIIESLRLLSNTDNLSFTEGKRNKKSGDRVEIAVNVDGVEGILKTVKRGGSETEWTLGEGGKPPRISFLPSRRVFRPYFGRSNLGRKNYYKNSSHFASRADHMDGFSSRLFHALDKYDAFSEVFAKVYGRKLDWSIEQDDNGSYYLKVLKTKEVFHNSDGMGEGLVSLLFLVDAIFESTDEEILVVDEPELSLHPQLQRRLLVALGDLAKDRQIVFATHSPEMISIDAIVNGMEVVRVVDEADGSKVYRLSDENREVFSKLEGDLFNPHAFAYESRACLFAEDDLVITEGQEDVIFFNKMVKDLGLDFSIPFWGFGAGGSSKIKLIASVLQSLGFKNISAVFDGDKPEDKEEFDRLFPDYGSFILPAEDIRDKSDRDGNIIKTGVFDTKKALKPEFVEPCTTLLTEINSRANP